MGPESAVGMDGGLVGRELELTALRAFLREAGSAQGMLLEGPAGIGKTSLFDAGVGSARADGTRVLVARPSDGESGLGLAALADLFEGVPLDGLTAPKRRALEVALLLRDAEDGAEPRALGAAVAALLGQLAQDGQVLVAIDDLQWLDGASEAALTFAARRLREVEVRFLLTARTARRRPTPLERALRPRLLTVEPLSFGATQRLVYETARVRLSRPLLRRIHEASGGNPLFALELAAEIARSDDLTVVPGDLPLPGRVEELLADRVVALAAGARTALQALALAPELRSAELRQAVGEEAVDEALASGVLVVEGTRVRLGHPLLGEVAKARLQPRRRRELHRRLAAVAGDRDRRVLHLALATEDPDAELAQLVASASARAERRGALVFAAELAEQGLRLTPAGHATHDERLLAAARCDDMIGRLVRSRELLRPAIDALAPGDSRVQGMLLLTNAAGTPVEEARELLERSVAEVGVAPALRVRARIALSELLGVAWVAELERATSLAADAVGIATDAGDRAALEEARARLEWSLAMRGLPVHAHATQNPRKAMFSRRRSAGVHHMWRGELPQARRLFEQALARAEERGEGESYVVLRHHLCELELRRGDWAAADALLDEWEREHDEIENSSHAQLRCRALAAAGRGDPRAARAFATGAIDGARATGGARWQELEGLRALGLADLLAGDAEAATRSLRPVWESTLAEGVLNPGTFPVAGDLAAALVASGRLEEAGRVTERLAALAADQDHPWGRAAVARARGLVASGAGDDETAAAALAEARQRFDALDMRFAAARCMIALGVAQRRLRRLRVARETLALAVERLEQLGSPGWAALARGEAARVRGRRPSSGALTVTERRVAQLVAAGLANKQVAAELVVSVSAVEAHLTRIFTKLGVHSRTELARQMATGEVDSPALSS